MAFEFHKDKKRYFDIQYKTTRDHIIPFIEQNKKVMPDQKVLEIGCGEAGVLKAFLEKGCESVGIELSEQRVINASKLLEKEVNEGSLQADTKAKEIAIAFKQGIYSAELVARGHNMVRAFCIAPTASCSYRSQDLDGYTCTPEIAPPVGRKVDRDSGTFGVQTYDYGNVEIASEVGWDAYKKVADELMKMLDITGLLHGYSFNSWSDVVTYDNAFVQEWLDSPQTSLCYSLQVMGDVQDKTDAYAALDDTDVEDYLEGLIKEPLTCYCQE